MSHERRDLDPVDLHLAPVHLLSERWMVLAAGQQPWPHYNVMTVSWGGFGVMWGLPIVMVAVRPSRHTFRFLEQGEEFTLSAFPDRYRDVLEQCGAMSGRDGDKAAKAGLTPEPARQVKVPGFAEAELVLECRKIYSQDCDVARITSRQAHAYESDGDAHRFYLGHIVHASATDAYKRS